MANLETSQPPFPTSLMLLKYFLNCEQLDIMIFGQVPTLSANKVLDSDCFLADHPAHCLRDGVLGGGQPPPPAVPGGGFSCSGFSCLATFFPADKVCTEQ